MVQRENPDSVIAQLFGGTVSQKLELAKRASPVTWVTKDAAPLLIMQGTKDPLVPLDHTAVRSNTPASKAIVIRLERPWAG